MSIEGLEERVIKWAKDRDLYRQSTPISRYKKMAEEFEELTDELFPCEVEDGGKTVVDLDLEGCLAAALEKVESRTGRMVDGTFVKSDDL